MPVIGVTSEDIDNRSEFFQKQIEFMINKPSLSGLGLVYHESSPRLMSHVYFSLSEAYKRIYLRDGSKTDAAKRAAITCATFSVINPIRPPLDLNDIQKEEYIYVNPMLAMRIACAIVGHPFQKRPFDDQRRSWRGISNLEFPCVSPIIAESYKSEGQINSNFEVLLSTDEESKLNLLIEQFSLYALMKTPEQSNR